jgi:ABC-type polysaccharide transport system permease subunit
VAFFFVGTLKKEIISSICCLVINLACTVILALIVNEIVTKYLKANL